MKDLVLLVADADMRETFNALLQREHSLGIRRVNYDIYVHPRRDPGLMREGVPFLADLGFPHVYRRGFLVLDAEWDGSPGASRIRDDLQTQIEQRGWTDRVKPIVINPELEQWVWVPSPHVAQVLRWGSFREIREQLERSGLWPEGQAKPLNPKEAFDRARRVPRSPSLFRSLAQTVSLRHCHDPAFSEFVSTMRDWFGA